jgi:ADP-ribose pyrophosphatase
MTGEPWQPSVSQRRTVSENRLLSYVEEDLLDRHGRPYTYYQVEAKFDAVVVVPVLPDGRLVVERIYRHPYRRWFLEFPAGGIEPGEAPLAAAARELAEETGWRARTLTGLGAHEALPGLLRMRLHLVLAEGLEEGATVRHDGMELIELERMSLEEAWAAAEGGAPPSSFLLLGLLAYGRHLGRRGRGPTPGAPR